MKTLLKALLFIATVAVMLWLLLLTVKGGPLPLSQQQITLTLKWNYTDTNLPVSFFNFQLYQSTTLSVPMSNWTWKATFPGAIGTNLSGTITNPAGHYFFVMSASNLSGEVAFSNTTNNPPIPATGSNLIIQLP